ncbi:MAG: hypothetical protein KGM42_10085 [Hyphomicrobiales bacterium]|nr:hypothetical protein [Hyphomicrobiales bacterium]
MPTAVEHKYFDAFLKLDSIDRPGEQRQLGEAFQKVDAAISALSGASDVYIKLEHKYDRTFDVIGEAFLKIGGDFQELAMVGQKVDALLTGGVVTTAAAVGGGGAAADFLKLDAALKIEGADLKIFGGDFLKWNDAGSPGAFLKIEAALGKEASTIGGDTQSLGGAFRTLASDILKLANPDSSSPVDLAYKELGGDLIKLSSQFDLLAADFIKLAGAFGDGGGAGTPANADVLSGGGGGAGFGAALGAISADFLKIDSTLSSLSGPVTQLLLPAVKPTLT